MANPVIPLQMTQEQADSIEEAAKELNLSRQDVIRQTLKFYLPAFVDRMTPKPKLAKRLSLWEALHFGRGLKLDITPMTGTVKKVTL
jgi:ribbon-helix-helix CopG family protein